MRAAALPLLYILLATLVATFPSCIKNENDLASQNCSSHCTIVSGQLLTNGGSLPLSSVPITLYWKNIQIEGGGVLREKAVTKTDANGNFRISFTMRSDELTSGYYSFSFSVDKNKYYLCSEQSDNNWISLPPLKADTLVYDSYLIPYKAFLEVAFTNPNDIHWAQGDSFTSTFTSKFENTTCGPAFVWESTGAYLNPVPIQANQPLYLETLKTKNGVFTASYDTLLLTPGEHKSFTVTF